MKIEINIPADRIANMMISFIESGDPVTCAQKGGWCVSVGNKSRKTFKGDWWYAAPEYFVGSFKFEVIELDDETTGHETKHMVRRADMVRGLTVMAQKFPHIFKQVLQDNTDAPCADILMQCVLFGEEKYA